MGMGRHQIIHMRQITQVNIADTLQALACTTMEETEAMVNLTSINLTLSQSLTQAQETILVLSKQLQALQVLTKKTQYTKRTALDKKAKDAKSKCYCWTHGRTLRLDHASKTCNLPNTGHQVGSTFGEKMGARSGAMRKRTTNRTEGREKL